MYNPQVHSLCPLKRTEGIGGARKIRSGSGKKGVRKKAVSTVSVNRIPVVRRIGSDERFEWNEGDTQPLTELARLLEIEKAHVDPGKGSTFVLSSLSVESRLSRERNGATLIAELGIRRRSDGKHGKVWEFLVQQGSLGQA